MPLINLRVCVCVEFVRECGWTQHSNAHSRIGTFMAAPSRLRSPNEYINFSSRRFHRPFAPGALTFSGCSVNRTQAHTRLNNTQKIRHSPAPPRTPPASCEQISINIHGPLGGRVCARHAIQHIMKRSVRVGSDRVVVASLLSPPANQPCTHTQKKTACLVKHSALARPPDRPSVRAPVRPSHALWRESIRIRCGSAGVKLCVSTYD